MRFTVASAIPFQRIRGSAAGVVLSGDANILLAAQSKQPPCVSGSEKVWRWLGRVVWAKINSRDMSIQPQGPNFQKAPLLVVIIAIVLAMLSWLAVKLAG